MFPKKATFIIWTKKTQSLDFFSISFYCIGFTHYTILKSIQNKEKYFSIGPSVVSTLGEMFCWRLLVFMFNNVNVHSTEHIH